MITGLFTLIASKLLDVLFGAEEELHYTPTTED